MKSGREGNDVERGSIAAVWDTSEVGVFFFLRLGGAVDGAGFCLGRLEVDGVGAGRFGFWVRLLLPNPYWSAVSACSSGRMTQPSLSRSGVLRC